MGHDTMRSRGRLDCGRLRVMRLPNPSILLLLAHAPTIALGQPVTVTLATHVPVGKKPTITVKAATRVVDLVLDLTRSEDGGKVTARLPVLGAGQSRVFPLGDGALGSAHYDGTLTLTYGAGESWNSGIAIDTMVNAEIKIGYQREHLFLDRHVLEFQISRPSKQIEAELTVLGDEGQEIGQGKQSFANAAAGKWLAIPWAPSAEGAVMVMKLHVSDAGGWADETLTPWSISIPHEEVNFATGSAVIGESERPKVDAAYALIMAEVAKAKRLDVRCSLFISGHTDTVGTRSHNQKLSVERAQAIAGYFRKQGLTIKVSYEGFGEDRPKVQTADETAEAANRRADYVLSAEAPPSLGQVFRWKEVK
ncbi:MAG: OmpA family protein [Myxococcales bacterium]|nr:OmpA family protein [Myxococcales bacterium]